MVTQISTNKDINEQIIPLDDQRRRLGIASLKGKIQSSLSLLNYAEKVSSEAAASYDDPKMTEAHLYSCMEVIYAALQEVSENSRTGMVLTEKIVGDKSVNPLEPFSIVMKNSNFGYT